jgi:hypothetical protein
MNTHADKTSENKSQAVADNLPKMTSNGESTFQFIGNRPEAIAQRELQEMANNSPQVSQLISLQEMANNSPQAKQAAQLKTMSKPNTATPIQQKKENGITQPAQAPEEEELLQGKFETVQRHGPEEEELQQGKSAPVQRVLIAGGTIAGLDAAFDTANLDASRQEIDRLWAGGKIAVLTSLRLRLEAEVPTCRAA